MGNFLDFISNFIEISGNQTIDTILIGVISILSFLIAFGIVGKIFEAIGIFDSSIMSGVHWTIRVIVFFGLVFIFTLIAKFFAFIFGLPWWVLVIIGFLIAAIIVLTIILIKRKRQKKNKEKSCGRDGLQ